MLLFIETIFGYEGKQEWEDKGDEGASGIITDIKYKRKIAEIHRMFLSLEMITADPYICHM